MEFTMGSLPVANVQALAAVSRDVPERYIRPEAGAHPVVADCGVDIPVIDFSRFLDPNSSRDESSKLHLACQNWGFFQVAYMSTLINHTVPKEVIEKMKLDVREFFQLPLEEKRQLAQVTGDVQGYGQLFVVSKDQKLDWADVLYLNTQPAPERCLRFIDIINTCMELFFAVTCSYYCTLTVDSNLRAALDNYSAELKNLADRLLEIMAKNLELNPDVVTDKFKVGIQSIRFNYYPPCPQADKVLGFSQHSDADLITLVLQVNQVQGLQIKRSGEWFPVKPLPGAFIVNVGDIFEVNPPLNSSCAPTSDVLLRVCNLLRKI
ncbi:hypothetical protein GW17_00010205 [Ensete ventricosum]|nr:hypothetical protein GW17_00010205 [Ensete ventricosum]